VPRVGRAFVLPLLGMRVPLGAAGVRILAALELLAAAGLVAAIVGSEVPAGRAALETAFVLASSLLALVATVPALLDGRLRFALAGIASLALGLVAAATVGLGGSPLAVSLAWLTVVIGLVAGLYHLLGTPPRERR